MAAIHGSSLAHPAPGEWHRARLDAILVVVGLFVSSCLAQESSQNVPAPVPTPQAPAAKSGKQTSDKQGSDKQINVSWVYGAYVPKDVPLRSLNGRERAHLWVRASFTTYGIYFKTALFSINDQINNHPAPSGAGWSRDRK